MRNWLRCSTQIRAGWRVHGNWLSDAGLDMSEVTTGNPDLLEQVIKENRADRVIITSPDYTHAGLIARAWMRAPMWSSRSR